MRPEMTGIAHGGNGVIHSESAAAAGKEPERKNDRIRKLLEHGGKHLASALTRQAGALIVRRLVGKTVELPFLGIIFRIYEQPFLSAALRQTGEHAHIPGKTPPLGVITPVKSIAVIVKPKAVQERLLYGWMRRNLLQ